MTIEEAIDYLSKLWGNDSITVDETIALEMAIKALEQKPCEDTISRQAVLEGIAEWVADGYADSEADISHISSLVTHLPSATPKEKTGKWIRVTDKTGHLVWECGCGWQQRLATNFCPDCGARMIEPQESEDKYA